MSKCIYCSSTSYGTGCIYSPANLHVHMDEPDKCIYCGSTNVGPGCVYNPNSDIHIRGIEYNSMVKESVVKNGFSTMFLMSRLYNEATDFDKTTTSGRLIEAFKELVSEEEFGMIVDTMSLQNSIKETANVERYSVLLDLVLQINDIVHTFEKVVENAQFDGVSMDTIESMVFEALV